MSHIEQSHSEQSHGEDLLEENKLLQELRKLGPARFRKKAYAEKREHLTIGQRASDAVARSVGSWTFIVIQSSLLLIWMGVNLAGYIYRWDPYPFILLNLVLSFQAAFTAPIIMMSQNRQAEADRVNLQNDFDINIKAELEIENLHQKIDYLRERELAKLIDIVERLHARLDARDGKV